MIISTVKPGFLKIKIFIKNLVGDVPSELPTPSVPVFKSPVIADTISVALISYIMVCSLARSGINSLFELESIVFPLIVNPFTDNSQQWSQNMKSTSTTKHLLSLLPIVSVRVAQLTI